MAPGVADATAPATLNATIGTGQIEVGYPAPADLTRARYSTSRSWTVWSRRGPTPIAATGAPIMSSTART